MIEKTQIDPPLKIVDQARAVSLP